MKFLRRVFDDRLTRAAAVIWLLTFALVIFNFQSNLPEQHPLFGVFDFLMVPVLIVAGGIVFALAIWRYSK